jgi:hypothetical protein
MKARNVLIVLALILVAGVGLSASSKVTGSFIHAGQTANDQSQVWIQTPNATVVDSISAGGEATTTIDVNVSLTKAHLFADLANLATGKLILVNGQLVPATDTPVPNAALAAVLTKYGVSVVGPDGKKLF